MSARLRLLTPRQTSVVELAVEGRSNAEIADALYVSMQTVKFHLAEVYRTLGIGSRYELIELWYDHEISTARRSIKAASLLATRELALRCAHETTGYAVDVEPGTELEVIAHRLEELERHCRSYGRSVQNLHRRLDAQQAGAS